MLDQNPLRLPTFFMIAAEPCESAAQEHKHERVGAYFVYRNENIRKITFLDKAGNVFCYIYGYPIFEEEIAIYDSDQNCFVFNIEIMDIHNFENSVISCISGSFIAVTTNLLPGRVYMDHAGSMPIVYSKDLGRAASSASMLLNAGAYEARFRATLYTALVDSRRNHGWSWFPGTLTAHQGVCRVLPNHFLDLANWQVRRFWPKAGQLDFERQPEDIVSDIATSLRTFLTQASEKYRVSIALTAGSDSRIVLAAARDVRDRLSAFTMTGRPVIRDARIAAYMAKKFGFRHRVLDIVTASPMEQDNWDLAVGHCAHESNRATHPSLLQLDDVDFILSGGYGEVGRTLFYKYNALTINDTEVSSKLIMTHMALANIPEVENDVELWLEALPELPASVVLDLAALELRFGSWIGAQRPAQSAIKMALYPFGQRTVLKGFLEARVEQKTKGGLFQDVGQALWPEIMDVPINKYGDYRDKLELLKRILDHKKMAVHLKKRLAHWRGG